MARQGLIQPAQAVTTAIVLSRITNPATAPIYISEIHVFATAGTLNQVIQFALVTLTADGAGGTTTGLMADRDTGALDTFSGTYAVYDGAWSTEPTGPVVLKRFAADMSPGFHIWQPKPQTEQRFNAGTTVRFGLQVTSAPGSSITLGHSIEFYSG